MLQQSCALSVRKEKRGLLQRAPIDDGCFAHARVTYDEHLECIVLPWHTRSTTRSRLKHTAPQWGFYVKFSNAFMYANINLRLRKECWGDGAVVP
jgi:hypothetical protein